MHRTEHPESKRMLFTKAHSWKPKQPETNGCFNMAIEILYIGNGCLGKHPFLSGCLGFQVGIIGPSVRGF